ncbi:hypothetical protein [Parasphingorhabdus sp.]|uniref:hypothetical protein n=1 Tax=Parasphingorhabdus sp. TaxID=2709688 RepID=UPI003A8FDF43
MAEPIDNMRHKMEDEAFLMFGNDCQSLYLSSIAISLKRIADALSGEGPSILTASLNSYGEGIGEAIQGQMIRGQRGIDQYEER